MAKLSVIIVNYNVKHFLEQSLYSVYKAGKGLEMEVFVVDNNSVDGSVKMVRERFPHVILIENTINIGFSKANNQAIRQAKGEYVLLLNPDTVLEDQTFTKVIQFMDSYQDAGGLGVKMVNGAGHFLPESKRSIPTPAVAFYKIFGLSAIFSKSRIFSKYHLGYLDKDKIHEVEILSGAFMFLRKSALDKIGLLDESFFMYGEDIDISYRLLKAGYKNYYYPETRIIHYKGASTRKRSVNYVLLFYNAMILFAQKHFSKKNAQAFSIIIKLAIYFRAFIALLSRFLEKVLLPLLDATVIFVGMYFLKDYWQNHNIYKYPIHYPLEYITIVVPLYIFVWLYTIYLSSGYDKPFRLIKLFQGLLIGTSIILVIYGLLSEHHRYSRALILLGALWAFISMTLTRYFLSLINGKEFRLGRTDNLNFLIIGGNNEAKRISEILSVSVIKPSFIGKIGVGEKDADQEGFIGNMNNLKEIVEIHNIDEIIFCAKDVPAHSIIDKMTELQYAHVNFKIALPESLYFIGEHSLKSNMNFHSDLIDVNSINKVNNKRNKRTLDVIISILLLIVSPIAFLFILNKSGFFKNIFYVLIGCKSWVGYYNFETDHSKYSIKKGVLSFADVFIPSPVSNQKIDNQMIDKINMLYAKEYKIMNDISIILKGFKNLGRI